MLEYDPHLPTPVLGVTSSPVPSKIATSVGAVAADSVRFQYEKLIPGSVSAFGYAVAHRNVPRVVLGDAGQEAVKRCIRIYRARLGKRRRTAARCRSADTSE